MAGRQGLLFAFLLAIVANTLVYFYGDWRIKNLFRSRPIQGQDPYSLVPMTAALATKLHIATPKLYLVEMSCPTAYSSSRSGDPGAIFISESLVRKLDPEELQSVLAFEILKIKSQHSFNASLCSAIAAGSLKPAEWLDSLLRGGRDKDHKLGPLTGLVAPLIAWWIRRMQTKASIFRLDQMTSELVGDPRALARSLWKLDSLVATRPQLVPKDTAHIFFMNPLPKYEWSAMFDAHPSARERIEKLIGQYPI